MSNSERNHSQILPPLKGAERCKVLYEWNATQVEFDREITVHDLVSAQGQRVPERTAISFAKQDLTYSELEHRSSQLAHYLRSRGILVESLVGLYINRSIDMVVGILGILKAGAAFVPIDPDLPVPRIKLMLQDAKPSSILTEEKLRSNLDGAAQNLICLDSEWSRIGSYPEVDPAVEMSSENLAYVIYTSGSTGRPKGVQIVHRSVVNQLDSKEKLLRFSSTDHLLATTTISFDPAVWEIFLPLTRGARLTIASREAMLDGAQLQQIIDADDVTIMRGTPTNWRILLASGWQGKRDLRAVSGGEELTLDLAREIRKRTAFLSNGYGPTEITIAATASIITPETTQITIGRPHFNTQIYILDENLQPVPIGATGEIFIAGEGVSTRGYLNLPELTAARFISNPFANGYPGVGKVMYKSGDMASYLPDGQILFHGRSDSQVKIRGYRVELGDIDVALRQHPAVAHNVTIAHEYGPGDRRLVSYLIPKAGLDVPDSRALYHFLQEMLPEYMLPSRFVIMDHFPRSPNGKIDRQALPRPDQLASQHPFPSTIPANKTAHLDMVQQPEEPSLLSAADRQKVLYQWNETKTPYDQRRTLHELISSHAQQTPHRTAVIYEDQSLTYAELEERSNKLAHYLISLGAGVETLIGLYVERSLDIAVGIVGILKAGSAYVPIDPDFPAARIKMMMEDAGTPILITQEKLAGKLDPGAFKEVALDRDWPLIDAQSSSQPQVPVNAENIAYAIYTSGSTGKPKAAQNIHRSIVNLVSSMSRRVGIDSTDNVLATTTLSFDPSVWEIFLPLTQGACLTVASREAMLDGQVLQQIIDREGVTFLRSTPTGWRLYLESGWTGGPNLKILSGGEKLTLDLAQQLLPHCAEMWQTYGPAEAAVFCTLDLITPDVDEITIGRPHDNIMIYILDEQRQPVPIGAVGEIYIGGDGVGRGYLNRPELAAAHFVPNPFEPDGADKPSLMYRTGDMARFRPDGQIVFIGREDQQVKIAGRRIELGEIDAALRSHPAVNRNVTRALEDEQGNVRIFSYLLLEPSQAIPDANEMRSFLRHSLPEYMIPSHFSVMENFPVSPSGKLDFQALPLPDQWQDELISDYIPPRSEQELAMSQLFAEVLNLPRVSIQDSFFELGGNSLLAVRLLKLARERLDVNISIRDFLQHPTVTWICRTAASQQEEDWIEHGDPTLAASPEGKQDQLLLDQSNLTRGQFLMWMGQQMNPEDPLYNVVHAFTIYGHLDSVAFQQAFQALVDQHDALRTIIVESNGVPRQTVLTQIDAAIDFVDYSGRSDPHAALQTFLAERQLRILHMDRPLFDAAIVKLAADRFTWYFCQHHILSDAISSELLFQRLGEYYALALEKRLKDITPPPQYADFVQYERSLRQKTEFQQAASYWQNKYDEVLPPTEFYGRTAGGGSTRTTRVVHDLGIDRSAQLRAIAGKDSFASPSEDLSLFNIFATLLFATLHRLNDQQKLRLGTPFHGRPSTESQDIAGLFIEMGVIQVDIAEGETFTSLGEKVMSELLQGLEHLQPGISSADINRAYNVILNFIQAKFHEFAGLAVQKIQIPIRHIDADHHLRLQIADYSASGSFTLLFDMKSELFDEQERSWLVEHFLKIVDAFIADHTRPLGDFTLLSDAQRQQLLVDFNQTDALYPSGKTVVQQFEEQVALTPDAQAAIEGKLALTYEELNQRANQLAHFLQKQGIGPEDPVLLCMERSLDVLVAIWGVLKSGGAYIPIDPAYPLERITYMLSDANAEIVLVNDNELFSTQDLPDLPAVIDMSKLDLNAYPQRNPSPAAGPQNLVYIIYTSGSTGEPKGTMLTHQGLMNYAWWARNVYQNGEILDFPLYSSLAFDLTVTSIFVPLLSGGKVIVYPESANAPGMEILSVFDENAVDIVKLTPAHLRLVRELELTTPRIRKLIVGGEDFKTDLALAIHDLFAGSVEIYNEYGPTEAVVGCMIHRYDPLTDTDISVPIGTPAANTRIYLLDEYDQPVPPGIIGELVISSDGVARGYHKRPQLSAERFGSDPFHPGARLYRTGDIARWNEKGVLVFLGRNDHQVKIGSARIELGEIETTFMAQDGIQDVVVNLVQFDRHLEEQELFRCLTCGLPSNYPDVNFNEDGVCNLCTDFDTFRDDVFKYFKTMDDLQEIVDRAKSESSGDYDCMMLYSGGKDSTYVLSQLVEMDLRVLAFSLDNDYISEEALDNVRRITDHLGVDLIIATTPHMNAIFADSLQRYSNVCQGCYKTIYTLSMNLARKKGIKYIFTGLSRGQLFETRLDELFRNRIFGVQQMDDAVLAARKIYHSVDDAVHRLLDVSMFRDDRVFEEIQFIDYFRYTEVELDELYSFLSTRVPWIRPQDTGRSTNCLINEAGIYVHQTERGYHNYALPYSWDVRLGHKTRAEAMEELDDDIRLPLVRQYLNEVDYSVKEWHADQEEQRLAAYFVANDDALTIAQRREHLGKKLPAYMMPAYFVRLEEMPLTTNGKIDRRALPNPIEKRPELDAAFVAPQSQLEIGITEIWSQTLNVQRVGIHDNFFDLGGASIPAVQIVARISDQYKVDFPVRSFFENPTVATQSIVLEELLISQLETMSDDEVEQLLAELGD